MKQKKNIKMQVRHQRLLKKFLITMKMLKKNFQLASKIDKGKSELKFKKSITERVKSRRQRKDIINKKKENINNEFFKEYFNYSNPDTMIKRLKDASDEKNKNMVKLINKNLNKMKKIIKNVPKDKQFKIEENEKIIDIVEKILELNKEKTIGVRTKNFNTKPNAQQITNYFRSIKNRK